MTRTLLFFMVIGLASTSEHWFIFDRYQFPGFYTTLFTLISSENKSVSFSLSTYDRSIIVDIKKENNNETIKLNIERADLLSNTINHMIFVVIRDDNKLESYVNCKLIDSYLFYSTINKKPIYKVQNIKDNIEHYEITSTTQLNQQDIFDTFSCKQINLNESSTSIIQRPLIRKMQHVIEKVQRRKLRSRRQPYQQISLTDSFTIIYKPHLDNNTSSHMILNIPELKFQIEYYRNEHLFNIRINNENHTQYFLYAEKSTDRISASNNSVIIFLHITPTMISCYVNCELIDQELILDQLYIKNLIEQIKNLNKKQYEYNYQSIFILFNKSIDEIGEEFFCSKLDKKNQDLLPDKYALRKFTNALDMLVNSLDNPVNNRRDDKTQQTVQNISAVNIPVIDGYGSLKIPPNNEISSIPNVMTEYNKMCLTNDDCDPNRSSMQCQSGYCSCPKRLFWSSTLHRCIVCHDILLGNRCFRLSNHKSTWYESNDYCQDDEGHEYTMKLSTNLNQTDIQNLKENYLQNTNDEHIDYMYWIGATSHFDTRKLHYRNKRSVPTTVFRWYDNGETAQLNFHELWCSQIDYMSLTTINNNQLCISLTSCGLYADDCQRNYRFLCEAV